MTGLMAGKRGLIMGLANDKSLAWGIAQRLKAEGAELAISYQGEVMEKRERPLAEQLGCEFGVEQPSRHEGDLCKALEVVVGRLHDPFLAGQHQREAGEVLDADRVQQQHRCPPSVHLDEIRTLRIAVTSGTLGVHTQWARSFP